MKPYSISGLAAGKPHLEIKTAMTDAPPTIWSEPVTIHSYDVDFSRQATVEALCRYFLEAAWNHAEALGFGFGRLARENKLWVLSRLLLTFSDYPRWGDQAVLKTWPREVKSAFALRDFEMLASTGERLAAGASAWLILDVASRRPQRVEKFLTTMNPVSRRATERDPQKLAARRSGPDPQPSADPRHARDLPRASKSEWTVRYSDVDLNGHVNSARYLGWLMDSYPIGWYQRHMPRQIEVNYLGESHQGETLALRTEQTGPLEFLHEICKPDQQEACRAHIVWSDGR